MIMLRDLHANLFKTRKTPSLGTRLLVDKIQSFDIGLRYRRGEITVIVLGRLIELTNQEKTQFAERLLTVAEDYYYRVGLGYIQPWGHSKVYASVYCGTTSSAGRRFVVDMTGGPHAIEGIFPQSDMHGGGHDLTKLILEKLLEQNESV